MEQQDSIVGTIDVRFIAPRDRHPMIFEKFASLEPGQAFMLVSDHAPKPLHYQFMHEHPGQFAWDDLEQGPEIWRVRISKTQSVTAQDQ